MVLQTRTIWRVTRGLSRTALGFSLQKISQRSRSSGVSGSWISGASISGPGGSSQVCRIGIASGSSLWLSSIAWIRISQRDWRISLTNRRWKSRTRSMGPLGIFTRSGGSSKVSHMQVALGFIRLASSKRPGFLMMIAWAFSRAVRPASFRVRLTLPVPRNSWRIPWFLAAARLIGWHLRVMDAALAHFAMAFRICSLASGSSSPAVPSVSSWVYLFTALLTSSWICPGRSRPSVGSLRRDIIFPQ